jgi:hypothetical protein
MNHHSNISQQINLFSKNNDVYDFLATIENEFEISSEEFDAVCASIPSTIATNQKIYKIKKKRSTLLSVLRLW